MRKILTVVMLIVVAAFGGFYAFWSMRASEIKNEMLQSIQQINEWGTTNANTDYLIGYEDISTSGFPTRVVVTLHNPRFKIPVNSLLDFFMKFEHIEAAAETPSEKTPAEKTDAPAHSWNEEVTLNGDMEVSVDFGASHFTLSHRGEFHASSVVDGKTVQESKTTIESPGCVISLERQGFGWDYKEAYDSVIANPELVRDVRCQQGAVLSSTASGEALYSLAGSDLSLTHAVVQGIRDIHFYLKVADMKFTPLFDEIVKARIDELRSWYGDSANLYISDAGYAAMGNQNVLVDIAFKKAVESESDDPAAPEMSRFPIEIAVNEFSITNDLFKTHLKFKLDNTTNAEKQIFNLLIQNTTSATALYDEMKLKEMQSLVEALFNSNDPDLIILKTIGGNLSKEDRQQMVKDFVPTLNDKGEIKFLVDFTASHSINTQGAGDIGVPDSFDLRNFQLLTSLYGITARAKADNVMAAMGMPGEIGVIECLTCSRLLTDLGNYLLGLEKIWVKFDPSHTKPYITDALLKGVKEFLFTLAQPEGKEAVDAPSDNLGFHFGVSEQGMPAINGHTIDKVMQLFGNLVAPHLPKPEEIKEPAEPKPTE